MRTAYVYKIENMSESLKLESKGLETEKCYFKIENPEIKIGKSEMNFKIFQFYV